MGRDHYVKSCGTQLAIIGILTLGGCAGWFGRKEPPKLEAPAIQIRQTAFAGSPLSGPALTAVKPDAATPLLAEIQVIALRQDPGNLGRPVASASRLISANRGSSTLQPTISLFSKARFSLDTDAGDSFRTLNDPEQIRSASIAAMPNRAILAGATSVSRMETTDSRAIEVAIYRPADGTTVSVAFSVVEPQEGSSAAETETAVLDPVDVANPRQVLITLPQSFTNSPAKGMAIFINLQPPGNDEQFATALKQAQDELAQSADLARSRPTTATIGSAASSGYQNSLDALQDPARRRAALIYLAGETGAGICEDFSLVAEDALVERAAAKISENLPPEASRQRDLLGWILDRSTLLLLAELAADTKNKMAPELIAVLTRHAGEAGRHDSSMEPIVKNLQSRADLDNRLIAENLIYLEDNSPSARVRAFDFLKARGKAPEEFDPLGAPKERRAALEKALTKE